jgi:hypothetical protein
MSGQDEESPYGKENPQAIARELGISLKALQIFHSIQPINPIGIPRSIVRQFGGREQAVEGLIVEEIARLVHEDFVREAVTARLNQEIKYINENPPETPEAPEIPEPSMFARGVGAPGVMGGSPNASPMPSLNSWGGISFFSRPPTESLMGGSMISNQLRTIDYLSWGFAKGLFGAATGVAPPGSTNFSETPNAPGRADDDDTGLVGPQGQGPTPPGTPGSLGDAPQS